MLPDQTCHYSNKDFAFTSVPRRTFLGDLPWPIIPIRKNPAAENDWRCDLFKAGLVKSTLLNLPGSTLDPFTYSIFIVGFLCRRQKYLSPGLELLKFCLALERPQSSSYEEDLLCFCYSRRSASSFLFFGELCLLGNNGLPPWMAAIGIFPLLNWLATLVGRKSTSLSILLRAFISWLISWRSVFRSSANSPPMFGLLGLRHQYFLTRKSAFLSGGADWLSCGW